MEDKKQENDDAVKKDDNHVILVIDNVYQELKVTIGGNRDE